MLPSVKGHLTEIPLAFEDNFKAINGMPTFQLAAQKVRTTAIHLSLSFLSTAHEVDQPAHLVLSTKHNRPWRYQRMK